MPAPRLAPVLATAIAAAVLGGVLAPPAAAASPQPRMLTLANLPDVPQFSDLTATRVVTGLRSQDYCHQQAFPKKTVRLRSFYNDEIGRYIEQYAVRAGSHAAAKKIAADAKHCFSKSYHEAQPRDPRAGTARFQSYGSFDTGDGLSAGNISLRGGKYPDGDFQWAVGRDGRYVTVLHFPMEEGAKPSAAGWVELAKKSVKRLR